MGSVKNAVTREVLSQARCLSNVHMLERVNSMMECAQTFFLDDTLLNVLDSVPDILAVVNGCVNLRTGKTRGAQTRALMKYTQYYLAPLHKQYQLSEFWQEQVTQVTPAFLLGFAMVLVVD